MKRTCMALCRAALVAVLLADASWAAVLYVKSDAAGANDGSSWGSAFTLLQSALTAAQGGDEIWVAAGTYMPTSDYGLGGVDRNKHFEMRNSVGLYGGFIGTESLRSQRNWTANVTTLSGDIGTAGNNSDNCYNIFLHQSGLGLDGSAVLDGFTVAGGNASADRYGGAMYNAYASPTISNCTFSDNYSGLRGGAIYNNNYAGTIANCTFKNNAAEEGGGAMFSNGSPVFAIRGCTFTGNTGAWGGAIYHEAASPTISDCTFSDNTGTYGGVMANTSGSAPTLRRCLFLDNVANSYGGALFNLSSSPTVVNCSFIGNAAPNGPAGAICNNSSSLLLTGCVFYANTAQNGGAMYSTGDFGSGGCAPVLTNCTFAGNTVTGSGGAVFNDNASTLSFRNSILWGDSAGSQPEVLNSGSGTAIFRNCDVQGSGGSSAWAGAAFGTDDGGNIAANPLFVNQSEGNLHPGAGSPCIDAGDGDRASAQDASGNYRFDDPGTANTGRGAPTYTDIGAFEYQLLRLTFPTDSGIFLERGKTYYINWVTSLPKGAKVRVELVNEGLGGESWTLSAGASKSPLAWTVGAWKSKTEAVYEDGTDYRIRITAVDDSTMDASASEFAINAVAWLEITGDTTVTGGSPAQQYTCTAHYEYGPDRDVSNEVKWGCSKVKGVKMGKTGLLTTLPVAADQACTIMATYGKGKPPLTGSLDITVSP